jgi:hypothetical protein
MLGSILVIRQENKNPKEESFFLVLPLLRTLKSIQFKNSDFGFTFMKIKIFV